MTPSFNGRTAVMDSGVRPSISLAFLPMAKTSLEFASTATTDGSRSTMPLTAHINERVGRAEVDADVFDRC